MSIKVLVADDSITIQKVIGIIFGGGEYSLTIVDNGKSAVEKAREINPDILLIDALMPGMSGYEVAEAVRSTPALATIPILILTGSFEPFDEDKAKRCGADDFIAKPFESQQIITKVKDLLKLGSTRSQQSSHVVASQQTSETIQQDQVVTELSLDTLQPSTPTDIWDAFTPEAELPVSVSLDPITTAGTAEASLEPDVFAIVNEESDVQLVQAVTSAEASTSHTGSQWVPVEENTFEFEEETVAESNHVNFADQQVPLQNVSFGDISFEEDISPLGSTITPDDSEQTFSIPVPNDTDSSISAPLLKTEPLLRPAPSEERVPTEAVSQPVTLTEEQLKAAITAASKEVIERIVWEVVPDLAEAMIIEAIRKIKEGI